MKAMLEAVRELLRAKEQLFLELRQINDNLLRIANLLEAKDDPWNERRRYIP